MSGQIAVERERCCGSGNCVVTAPEVFDQDDADGLVLVLIPRPAESQTQSVRLAVQMCPVGAISFTREEATT